MKIRHRILWAQAIYFLISALWPLIHINSFMSVTGYKTDIWLVKTVAVLLLSVCTAFFAQLVYKKDDRSVYLLAVSSSLALVGIDCYYVFRGTISTVYLFDAAIECLFVILYLVNRR